MPGVKKTWALVIPPDFRCDLSQIRQYIAQRGSLRIALAERKVHLAIKRKQAVVDCVGPGVRLDRFIGEAHLFLRCLDRRKRFCCQQRKDARAKTRRNPSRNKHWLAQYVCINLVQHLVVLWNASGVDYAVYRNTISGHALEDDAGVEGSAFNCGIEFVLRCVNQVPSEA